MTTLATFESLAQPEAEPATVEPGLARPARILGTIVAPTSLVTALFYYFGWSHAYWFFDYFGVNSTLLGLTTGDYLMRSMDALFVPLTVVACLGLAALWAQAHVRSWVGQEGRRWRLRALVPLIGLIGVVLIAPGLVRVFGVRTPLDEYVAAAPLSLAVGVLLVAYAVYLRRLVRAPDGGAGLEWRSVGEWLGVFVLVGLSLFWAASDYSAAVGRGRAREFVAELPTYPSVFVYSNRSLSLHLPGVSEVRCADPEASYRFRYDGLKLVLQSGDQYVLLPTSWSANGGVAVLLPRSEALRLEFTAPGPTPPAARTC